MDVVLFGATGMVGQGALRECLLDPGIERVVAVGRRATGVQHAKLREMVLEDVSKLAPVAAELTGLDACLFCLGVSSAGMPEDRYAALTYDLTLAVAETLVRLNPGMTFVYVSGTGADSSERGRLMWARVRGRTENALLRLPFRGVFVFRPAGIIPLHGSRASNRWTRLAYTALTPLHGVLRKVFPAYVTTTEELAKAMIAVARHGSPAAIIEARGIGAVR